MERCKWGGDVVWSFWFRYMRGRGGGGGGEERGLRKGVVMIDRWRKVREIGR